MNKWNSKIRQARLMASSVVEQRSADPAQFARNLSERLKTVPVVGSVARQYAATRPEMSLVERQAREAYSTGEISVAISKLKAGDSGHDGLIARYQGELDRLQQAFVTSLPLQPAKRVLHLLTNSLPHTNSGYSLRSHAVLKAMNSVGLHAEGVTRLGYPASVGRFVSGQVEEVDGIRYHRLLPETMPRSVQAQQEVAVSEIIDLARSMGAEALHTTTGFEHALIVSRAAMILEIPWIYEMRGQPERTWLSKKPALVQHVSRNSEYFRLARSQELAAAKNAAAVVVLSEIMRQDLIERGIEPAKIWVIPNGVDDDVFSVSANKDKQRRALGIPADKIVVGAITAVVDYEGLEYLLDAVAELGDKYHAVIVGDGAARIELEAQAQKLGVQELVTFVGKQPSDTIWQWYTAMDVIAVPRKDTLVCRTVTPIKTVMAQALGVPVVASDLPALREVTGDIETYVAPEDSSALAAGIRQVASGNDTHLRNPQEAVDWANSRRWSELGKLYAQLYS